jgi:hypothetical protein
MRAGFLVKDAIGLMKNSPTDKIKYDRMKYKAIKNGLVDTEMKFS